MQLHVQEAMVFFILNYLMLVMQDDKYLGPIKGRCYCSGNKECVVKTDNGITCVKGV